MSGSYYQYTFSCPVKINAGRRALEHIPFELGTFNAKKPLVLTTKDLSDRGLVDILQGAFGDSGMTIGVYDGVPSDPDAKLIMALADLYRDRGFDAVIALGRGTVADTAKVLDIVVSGKPEDLVNATGDERVQGPLAPFFLVPTGSMDGREVSRYANLGDAEYASYYVMPDLVVIDPRMMVSMPFATTAASMMVTLTQAADAYRGPYRNPLSDAYAGGALKIILNTIDPMIGKPEDRMTRLALTHAAVFACCAFSNIPKGMAYVLGNAAADVGHLSPGFCMGAVLPHCLSFYQQVYGAGIGRDKSFLCTADDAKRLVDKVYRAGAGVPSLKEAGFSEVALKETAQKAAGQKYSEEDCLKVLLRAWNDKTGP